MKRFFALLLMLSVFRCPLALAAEEFNKDTCSAKGIPLKGKVQVVRAFADLKVETVQSFPDIRVERVGSFPDDCGEWQFVSSFPDFTIEFVDAFGDVKVEFVHSFPGVR